MGDVQLDGFRLHWEEQGEGDVVLLLPGLGGSARTMIFQAGVLAPSFRCLSVDNRGGGRSDVPDGPYTTKQMAADAIGLLDHLGIERARVLGHSMGSCIAQEIALAHPQRVERLVLISPWMRLRKIIARLMTVLEDAIEHQADNPHIWFATFPWFASPTFMANDDIVEAAVSLFDRPPDPKRDRGRVAQLRACIEHDTTERVSEITAPTLVLAGGDDIVSPPANVQAIAEAIAGAQLKILDHGGHGVIYEFPEEINQAVVEFM